LLVGAPSTVHERRVVRVEAVIAPNQAIRLKVFSAAE